MRLPSRVQRNPLKAAALEYVERGWPVLPLVPRQKRPLTKSGLLDASLDINRINEWWSRWPFANIGLRTGVAFDVLDIDGPVGLASVNSITHGEPHSGPVSHTGKGEHRLFKPNNSANRTGILEKLDWRGTNGYIVAPPSIHPDGHNYAWDPESGPDTQLPEVPEWLSPLLVPYVERPTDMRINIKANPYGISIVDIADELGYQPRYSGGGRFSIACPFHTGDREPSLVLYPDSNTFYCFGCGAWGDILNLRDKNPRYKHA